MIPRVYGCSTTLCKTSKPSSSLSSHSTSRSVSLFPCMTVVCGLQCLIRSNQYEMCNATCRLGKECGSSPKNCRPGLRAPSDRVGMGSRESLDAWRYYTQERRQRSFDTFSVMDGTLPSWRRVLEDDDTNGDLESKTSTRPGNAVGRCYALSQRNPLTLPSH